MLYESHRDSRKGVVDIETGRILIAFPPGMVTVDPAGHDAVLLTFTATTPSKLAVYRVADDGIELRGALEGTIDQGCRLGDDRLACLVSDKGSFELQVTAVG